MSTTPDADPFSTAPAAWRVRRIDSPDYWIVFLHEPVDAMNDPEREVQPLYTAPPTAPAPQAGDDLAIAVERAALYAASLKKADAENDALRAAAERMRSAGGLMSNWMFNIAQRCGEVINADHCKSLDTMRKDWDAAISKNPL